MTSPALIDVDYYNFSFFGGDDTYLYGQRDTQSRARLFRVPIAMDSYAASEDVTTASFDFGTNNDVRMIQTTSVAGEVFATIQNSSTGLGFIYRSSDYADNFTLVAYLGSDDPANNTNQISQVFTEGSGGFCEATIAGVRTYFVAEYNVNGSRVAGSTNDAVKLIKSTDGINWTIETTWNTDGSNTNIRHIHTVEQDPYTGNICIATGDIDAHAGIIVWDGVSAWTDNLTLTALSALSGFDVYHGSQRYRATTMLFTSEFIYSTCDADALDADAGIWRLDKTTGDMFRVNNELVAMTGKTGWRGFQMGGKMVFSDYMALDPTANYEINFWSAYEQGTAFERVARLGIIGDGSVTKVVMNGFFTVGDKIYYSPANSTAAGKNDSVTCVMQFNGDFTEPVPATVYPTYYVGVGGVDTSGGAKRGKYPSFPYLTLGYALSGSKVTEGANVQVSAGSFSENAIVPVYNARIKAGESGVPLTIRGQGIDVTSWVHDGSGSIACQFTTAQNITFKDVRVYSENGSTLQNSSTINVDYLLIDSYIGTNVNAGVRTVRQDSGTCKLYRSTIEAMKSSNSATACYESDSSSADIEIHLYEGSMLKGGFYSLDINNFSDVYMYNSYAVDYYGNFTWFGSAYEITSDYEVRGNIIWSDQAAGMFKEDIAGTLNLPDMQNNSIPQAANLSAVIGAGNVISNPEEVDPFVDFAGGDFTINGTMKLTIEGSGNRYWGNLPNPVGLDGEPFTDIDTDAGPIQSKSGPFHPTKV